ncbi:hypothetical protein BSL78_19835 [Apostichopus japonicus]|uniref:Uncharacterized protein n=1 Tax=Stichopus japonicus TaxID=307972 RepID=A0A2G8K5P3_STIJA|nr:hypothetical protein BSL78_19835 [Apostichopus japonicus]
MEDTYNLNVVTEWPQCLAKFNESDNSFQLFCYTFSQTGQNVPQTWEIIEPGDNSKTFLNFTIQHNPSISVVKIIGVSHSEITDENLTDLYKCSHSNDSSRSCFFTFNSPMIPSPTPLPDTRSSGPSDQQSEQVVTGPVTAPSTTKRRVPQQTSFKLVGIGLSCAVVGFIVPFIALLFTCYKLKDRKNASKAAENEGKENPAAAAAYSMKIYNTTDQTMYETTITNNTNNTYEYADQRELNTRELPRQFYGTQKVPQYETVQ